MINELVFGYGLLAESIPKRVVVYQGGVLLLKDDNLSIICSRLIILFLYQCKMLNTSYMLHVQSIGHIFLALGRRVRYNQ